MTVKIQDDLQDKFNLFTCNNLDIVAINSTFI